MLDRFMAAPVPGESLTVEPGSRPYEKPPQFADVDDALMNVMESLADEEVAMKLLNLMDVGVPVSAVVQSLIMSGFMEGKWTPDVGLLMSRPLAALLVKMADVAGVDVPDRKPKQEVDRLLMMAAKKKSTVSSEEASQAVDSVRTSFPKTGLLAKSKSGV